MRAPAALAPFRTRSFRFQWPADLCTAWALEMETLILGWYVLVESGSVVMLTVFGALMFVGTLLSPLLGMLGDRLGLRRLLAAMRSSYAVFAGLILLLAVGGWLSPHAVLGVAFLAGLIKPSDIGMRSALVGATVPAQHLVAAMGISRTTQDSARIGGALAGAGFMAAFGMVPAYITIVCIHVLGVFLTWQVADGRAVAAAGAPPSPPRPSPWGELKEGLLYVWRTPRMLAAMSVAALVNLSAFPLTGGLMPYIAREVFQVNQQGLGWLVASFATGALVGSLSLSVFGTRVRPARTMMVTCVVWYLCLAGLALPIDMRSAMVLLAGAGLAQSLSMVTLSIMLLRTADPRFQGRVMGVRMLAIYTLPLGLLAAGQLIPLIGFRPMVALFVALGLVGTLVVARVWRHELLPRDAVANWR